MPVHQPPPTPQSGTRTLTPCSSDPTRDCEFRSIGRFIDQSLKIGPVEVARCARCGHGISLPPLGDPFFLYEGRESQDFQRYSGRIASAIKRIAFRRAAQRLLWQLRTTPDRLLDFGCGSGQFTEQLGAELGSQNVSGSDFFSHPPPGMVSCRYFTPAALAERKIQFDAVIVMHVLEHDEDPRRLLVETARLVRPRGILVIEVPNVECIWARIFGKYWDAWYLPFHRQHFNRRSLTALIEREGLELLAIHSESVPTMGRTLRNIFGPSDLLWLWVGVLLHPIQLLGEKIGGEPSAIRAVVRKP